MENQQERLIWLAGLIDGEGSFGIDKHDRKNGYTSMTPKFSVINTSSDALPVVIDILKESGVAFYVGWRAPGKYRRKKWQWAVEVSGVKRMARFLPVLIPHLIIKQQHAKLLLGYCQSRLERTKDSHGWMGKSPLTEADYAVWKAIKALNQNPQRTYAEPVKGRYVPSLCETKGGDQKCVAPCVGA